jgi:signal recognition particle subunit SRP54
MLGGGLGGMPGAGAVPPGRLPGLPGGNQPFNLPPGFDKFMKK